MRTELKEQSEFLKILKSCGISKCYKVTASVKGVPDLEAVIDHTIYKFEVKTPDGKLSELQKWWFRNYPKTFLVVKENGIFYYDNMLGYSLPQNKRLQFRDGMVKKFL